jgi:hypothetical protein
MSRSAVIVLVCVLLGGSGLAAWYAIGRESPEARQALGESEALVKAGLEAWKAKRAPASLAKAQPALLVDDQDWKAGALLLDYEVVSVNFQEGDRLPRCFVKLKLQWQGKTLEREVCYIVDNAKRVITRDPYS